MINSCRVCSGEVSYIFSAEILEKYEVNYYACKNCGFVQTEKPYWLNESYSNSINLVDTGLTRRNVLASKSVSVLLLFLFNKKGKYLDYAGGYGMFARLMRDIGFDFYTTDPFTPNLLARGFDYCVTDQIELVTTFESFEHFVEPILEIEKILTISRNIFFSTHLIPNPIPHVKDWWYYGTNHGQHISFYSPKTLKYLAKKYNLNLCSFRGYHLFTDYKINNFLFKFLVGSGRFGLYKIAIFFIRSKVIKDMKELKNRKHIKIGGNLPSEL